MSDDIDDLTNFEPMTTKESILGLEQYSQEMTPKRRIVTAVLSKDANELFEIVEGDPDVAEEMFEQVVDYVDRLDTFRELATACCTRLLIALAGLEDSERFQRRTKQWQEAVKYAEKA